MISLRALLAHNANEQCRMRSIFPRNRVKRPHFGGILGFQPQRSLPRPNGGLAKPEESPEPYFGYIIPLKVLR